MIRLNMQQVLLLHEELIQETGGIHGLRYENLLESALAAPFQTFNDSRCIRRSNRRLYDFAMVL